MNGCMLSSDHMGILCKESGDFGRVILVSINFRR